MALQQTQAQTPGPLEQALARLDALVRKATDLEAAYSAAAANGGQVPDLRLMQTSDDVAPIRALIIAAQQQQQARGLQLSPVTAPVTGGADAGATAPAGVAPEQQNGVYLSLPAAAGLALAAGVAGGIGGWWARGMKKLKAHEAAAALEAAEDDDEDDDE